MQEAPVFQDIAPLTGWLSSDVEATRLQRAFRQVHLWHVLRRLPICDSPLWKFFTVPRGPTWFGNRGKSWYSCITYIFICVGCCWPSIHIPVCLLSLQPHYNCSLHKAADTRAFQALQKADVSAGGAYAFCSITDCWCQHEVIVDIIEMFKWDYHQ